MPTRYAEYLPASHSTVRKVSVRKSPFPQPGVHLSILYNKDENIPDDRDVRFFIPEAEWQKLRKVE